MKLLARIVLVSAMLFITSGVFAGTPTRPRSPIPAPAPPPAPDGSNPIPMCDDKGNCGPWTPS